LRGFARKTTSKKHYPKIKLYEVIKTMTASSNQRKGWLDIAVVLSVFLVTCIASQILQPPITYNNGQSFDGVFYIRMAYQMSNSLPVSSEGPFVYRLGTPFLAGLFFPDHLLLGFRVVNVVANLISTLLFLFWLRFYLTDWRIRALLVTLYITAWHGVVRFTFYDPSYTDPWWFVFLLAGLIVMEQVRRLNAQLSLPEGQADPKARRVKVLLVAAMGAISFVGVIFREVALVLPLAFLFITNPFPQLTEGNQGKKWQTPFLLALIPLALSVAAAYLTHRLAAQYNDYSFIQTALDWAYTKPAPSYLHAFFITFGPLIVLPLCFWGQTRRFLAENQHLLVLLAVVLVLSWVGGSDTEKFLFWAMPVVYVLIGLGIQSKPGVFKSWPLALLLAASTVLSMRWFWVVPDYPNSFKTPFPVLSILSNHFQYLDLWSFFAERSVAIRSLVEYLALSAVLVVWIKRREAASSAGNAFPKSPSP
jgi:hypothetical protein